MPILVRVTARATGSEGFAIEPMGRLKIEVAVRSHVKDSHVAREIVHNDSAAENLGSEGSSERVLRSRVAWNQAAWQRLPSYDVQPTFQSFWSSTRASLVHPVLGPC